MQFISSKLDKVTLEQTAASLKAIAHPVRLAMIDLLKDGRRMNVTQIYSALGLEQAVASQHLSILKEKQILASKRQGKHSYYFLKHPHIVEVINLLLASREEDQS
ncbi:MAG: metalloregulator ArsR/SmtB family transcription factor [Bacteroidota bacterium]